jgi:hypothetical protein
LRNATAQIDPNGRRSIFANDLLNRMIRQTDPLGGFSRRIRGMAIQIGHNRSTPSDMLGTTPETSLTLAGSAMARSNS